MAEIQTNKPTEVNKNEDNFKTESYLSQEEIDALIVDSSFEVLPEGEKNR